MTDEVGPAISALEGQLRVEQWQQAKRSIQRLRVGRLRRQYGGRWRRATMTYRRVHKPRWLRQGVANLPELNDFDPPILLPDEPVPPSAESYGPARPMYWDTDGTPFLVGDREDRIRRYGYVIRNKRVAQTMLHRDGVKLWISTVFLGTDHNYWGGPPILWETMIFHDGDGQEQYRYASRAAALHGHRTLVSLLRAGRRRGSLLDAATR